MRRSTVITALAAAALAPRPGYAQTPSTVLVSMTSSDAEMPIVYGITSGLFRRAGLNVVQQPAASGAAAMAAVLGGALHLAGSNLLTLAQAHLKGVPFEAVAPGGLYNGTSEFTAAIVKTDAPFRTGRDLNGKTAGVASVGDLNAITLLSWIDQHGGDSKTIKQVEMPYSLVAAALDDGRIDVSTILQPFLSQAVDSGKARVFAKAYDAIAPRFVFTAWIASTSWTAANADVARRFARAIRESEIYCNAHRTETAPLLAELAHVDVVQVLRGGRDTFAGRYLQARDVQPLIDAAARYGAIDHRFDGNELISPAVRGLSG